MQVKKIFMAADHAGYQMKQEMIADFQGKGYDVTDLGVDTDQVPSDYPDQAASMARAIKGNPDAVGVLLCGSGIGMSMAINRYSFIRAALVYQPELATMARRHEDANVLILSQRYSDIETAKACADAFFSADFDGGRHEHRIQKLQEMPDVE